MAKKATTGVPTRRKGAPAQDTHIVIGPDGTVRVLDMSPELLEVALQLDPTNQRLLRYKAMLEGGKAGDP